MKISDATAAASRFISATKERIRPEGRASSVGVYPGDLILSNSATPGLPMFMSIEACIHDGWMLLRNFRGLDKEFAYYLLLHDRAALVNQGNGSVFTNLKTDILKDHVVRLPPLPEQRAIARVLGDLDSKIELNRKMSRTLEAVAMALFKSWFVDFDPVREKAEGRATGLTKHVDELFPNSFVDSDYVEIPNGWRWTPLPEAIEVNPHRELKKGAVAPYLDMANAPTTGHSADEVIEREFGSGMRFTNGDTLVARITPCLENGKTAYVDFLKAGQVGWGSTEFIVLRPMPPLPTEFGYCLARSEEFRAFAIQSMTGSSGRQRVPAEALSKFFVAMPGAAVANAFSRLVGPLMLRARECASENRRLTVCRETLLPRLVSGELQVVNS